MSCENFQKALSLFLDGELAEKESLSIQEHLRSCPDCKEHYQSWQSIDRLYREAPVPGASASFRRSLLDRLPKALPEKKPAAWWKAACILAIFLSGALAGGMGVAYWNGKRGKSANAASENGFPYVVKLKQDPQGYFVVIENEKDEKQWEKFLSKYASHLQEMEKQRNLNRYKIDAIPATAIQYGDF